MHKSQANRARIAARAAAHAAAKPAKPRPDLPAHMVMTTGPVRRTRALPMTGAQRDSAGRYSDWNRAAHVGGRVKPVMIDTRWDRTVSGATS